MEILFFQSDGMPDEEVIGILETIKIQRQRWIGSFHPESRIRRLALQTSGMKIGAGTHLALGLVVIDIIGIINAASGKQKELPIIGQFARSFNF